MGKAGVPQLFRKPNGEVDWVMPGQTVPKGWKPEVTARTELLQARTVIAEARRIERDLHVARERDPAALRGNLAADCVGYGCTMGKLLGRGWG